MLIPVTNQFAIGAAAAGGFSPTDIAGLVAWYDASDAASITESGGAVSQWNDLSGNGWHLTQATGSKQPTTGANTMNSLNVISFDPSSGTQLLKSANLGGIFPSAFSLFVVFERTGSAPTYPAVCTITAGGSGAPIDAYSTGRFYNNDNFANTSGMVGLNLGSVTGPTIIGWIGTNAGDDLTERVNGSVYATGSNNTQWPNYTDQKIVAGSRADEVTALRGRIAEIVIYDSALGASDITAVEDYLNTKWSVY